MLKTYFKKIILISFISSFFILSAEASIPLHNVTIKNATPCLAIQTITCDSHMYDKPSNFDSNGFLSHIAGVFYDYANVEGKELYSYYTEDSAYNAPILPGGTISIEAEAPITVTGIGRGISFDERQACATIKTSLLDKDKHATHFCWSGYSSQEREVKITLFQIKTIYYRKFVNGTWICSSKPIKITTDIFASHSGKTPCDPAQ